MNDRILDQSALAALAEDFGGYSTLALILNVSVEELKGWTVGSAQPPASLYPRLLDLVLER